MNDEARDTMHLCKEALQKAEKNLQDAVGEVENTSIKNQITNQLEQVGNCLEECQKICSGLSQYKTEKKFDGIHY